VDIKLSGDEADLRAKQTCAGLPLRRPVRAHALFNFPKLSAWGSGSASPSSGAVGCDLRGNLLKKDSQIGACLRSDIMMFAPLRTNRFGGD